MGLLSRFTGGAVKHVADPVRSELNVKKATDGAFRQGMWVDLAGRIGILTALNSFGVADVMLVDDQGMNSLAVTVPIDELKRATAWQIPAPRRPSDDTLRTLGYEV